MRGKYLSQKMTRVRLASFGLMSLKCTPLFTEVHKQNASPLPGARRRGVEWHCLPYREALLPVAAMKSVWRLRLSQWRVHVKHPVSMNVLLHFGAAHVGIFGEISVLHRLGSFLLLWLITSQTKGLGGGSSTPFSLDRRFMNLGSWTCMRARRQTKYFLAVRHDVLCQYLYHESTSRSP